MTKARQSLFGTLIVGTRPDPKPETLELTRLEKNPAVDALRKLGGNAGSSSPRPKKDKR